MLADELALAGVDVAIVERRPSQDLGRRRGAVRRPVAAGEIPRRVRWRTQADPEGRRHRGRRGGIRRPATWSPRSSWPRSRNGAHAATRSGSTGDGGPV